jgi:hypothetical protein
MANEPTVPELLGLDPPMPSVAMYQVAAAAAALIANFVDGETPVDSGDHQHFTLANAPNPAASLHLYVNGLRQTAYSLSGTALTMNAAIVGAFTMQADYRYFSS